MSIINQDKDVIEQGRKSKLKDAEAPLRDQIDAKLYKKLEEMNIGQKVVELWDKGSANRSNWLERQKEYLASWDEHLIADTEGAFKGSSNLHIPMPLSVCKTLHARFMQATWQDPPCHTRARRQSFAERVPMVQDMMRFATTKWCNHNKGARRVVDLWLWDWITMGSGLLKQRWECLYERYVDVVKVPKPGNPKIQLIDGREVATPTTQMVEEEVPVSKKVFEGPMMELKDPEDVIIIGGGGDPDAAEAVLEQQFLTASDLWTLADRKIFRESIVAEVIEGGNDRLDSVPGSELKTQRLHNAGHASLDSEQQADRYGCIEAYLKVNVDGSGIDSNVVVWVHRRSRKLFRATYLRRINSTGERPYAKIDFHLRKGAEYGIGMVELLYPLSKEMDAIHNLRIDFGLISVMPFGFFRASSGIDAATIQLEPGMLIPCDNPQQDVFFPNLGNRTVFGFQEEQAIQTMVERLTSISDLSLGMMGGSQGATRTATGARALVNEISSNLDVYLGRLNEGWGKALSYLLHTLQQRMPEGLSFRVVGDDGNDYWREVKSPEAIAGDYDVEVSPNSASSNPGIQQEKAQTTLQLVMNPLAMQMGIVTGPNIYEALKGALQANDVRDFGRFITKPQGYDYVLTPIQEMDSVLAGVPTPVMPNSDHDGFIKLFKHFLDDPELHGQLEQDKFLLLAAQAKKHEQMKNALAQAQAQQSNVAQMRMNASMSAQQAPTQLPQAPNAQPAGPV